MIGKKNAHQFEDLKFILYTLTRTLTEIFDDLKKIFRKFGFIEFSNYLAQESLFLN